MMKKVLTQFSLLLAILVFAVGCTTARKSTDGGAGPEGGDSSIRSETTASGGTENIEAAPMNLSATGSDSGTIAGLQTVFFDFDKSTISGGERTKLQGNADWMKKNSGYKMTIEGHCDSRGSNEYNLSLGERRANAVKQMLIDMGVPTSRLTTVSYGEEKPLVQGDSDAAMAKNRRANFVPVQ